VQSSPCRWALRHEGDDVTLGYPLGWLLRVGSDGIEGDADTLGCVDTLGCSLGWLLRVGLDGIEGDVDTLGCVDTLGRSLGWLLRVGLDETKRDVDKLGRWLGCKLSDGIRVTVVCRELAKEGCIVGMLDGNG